MAMSRRRTFPLVPRYRLSAGEPGAARSVRRGDGSDIAGMRPYRPGDRLALIDWQVSGRLSAVQNEDVFIVREYYADEAPRVIVTADRHPSMALYPSEFPWLSKPRVLREAITAIVASAHAGRSSVGYLDFSGSADRAGAGAPYWLPPRRMSARQIEHRLDSEFEAPSNAVERALDDLVRRRHDVPSGSFVFVISDFLRPPPLEAWLRAYARKWDVVPVIIQDPVWEQSFPAIGGVMVSLLDPESGQTGSVRLTAREASERRRSNEAGLATLLDLFRQLSFDAVLLEESAPAAIDSAFLAWATRRRLARRAA
jgi:uncharacterized protein (DUF58 family)